MDMSRAPRRILRHLNYNHLLYFWTVAREGSITAAADVLSLTPQTISGQIKLLEQTIEAKLFERVGRGLALTEVGRAVMPYADEIFSLGTELARRVQGDDQGLPSALNVGIVNSLPKLVVYRTLAPLLQDAESPRLSCTQADLDALLADLAVHRLDLVLSDRPVPTGFNVRAYSHKLGESDIAFYGRGELMEKCRANYPASLHGAPMLMPAGTTSIRRGLDAWLARQGVVPTIVADFDDSALMKAFGQAGVAIFPAPMAIDEEVKHMYGVERIGMVDGLREMLYLISPERRLSEPFALEITDAARQQLKLR
ncbi:MAG: transcriptional activator NhaR [Pseudomonadota bacterium]